MELLEAKDYFWARIHITVCQLQFLFLLFNHMQLLLLHTIQPLFVQLKCAPAKHSISVQSAYLSPYFNIPPAKYASKV